MVQLSATIEQTHETQLAQLYDVLYIQQITARLEANLHMLIYIETYLDNEACMPIIIGPWRQESTVSVA